MTIEQSLVRLYERVLESAIELSGAESGVLLRVDQDGKLRVRVARSERGPAPSEAQISQSIVARVLASGQALSTVDAAEDARLAAASSVHALALRSVLALPIRLNGGVLGLIYLEDRLRPFAFAEVEVALLSDFSDLAALSISGLERLQRERRAVRRLSLAQQRLSRQLEAQAIELSSAKTTQDGTLEQSGIVARSEGMREVLSLALRVARSDVPVLIRGESGTGKELVARAIHAASSRSQRPFITENCAAIPETLLESALFGHVKGAFTGADRRRIGLFEAAHGGSLLLDEIGEMTPAMQARLLRVLQEGEVRPLGGDRIVRVDVRVLAATHRDLEAMVKQGTFREDLFYRLAVVSLAIPPLRERTDDIVPLVRTSFTNMRRSAHRVWTSARSIACSRKLARQRASARKRGSACAGVGRRDAARGTLWSEAPAAHPRAVAQRFASARPIDRLERQLIRRALEISKGNQTRAAELLGVSRFGLQKMLKRLGETV